MGRSRRAPAALLAAAVTAACAPSEPRDAGPVEMPPPADTSCPAGKVDSPQGCVPVAPTCGAGTRAQVGEVECQPVGMTACPSGFTPDGTGWGCTPILPSDECGAGTAGLLGSTDCQAVGWTGCAGGFRESTSGWGCEAILPSAACTGARRAALGMSTCVDIGDCGAAFPPAGAWGTVNSAFTDAELGPTKFKALQAALDAAPAGGLIAIERGRHSGSAAVRRDVQLAGRCAAETVIEGSITVRGGTVAIRGLAIAGNGGGVTVESGDVTGEDLLFDNLRGTAAQAAGQTTKLALRRTVIRGVRRSGGAPGIGIRALQAARVDLSEVEVSGADGLGVVALSGAAIDGQNVVVRDTVGQSNLEGVGIDVEGAKLSLSGAAVFGNSGRGVLIFRDASEVTLERAVIRDSRGGPGLEINGGTVAASHVHLEGNMTSNAAATGARTRARITFATSIRAGEDFQGMAAGLTVYPGARVEFEDSAAVLNPTAGVGVVGGTAIIARSRIGDSTNLTSVGLIAGQAAQVEVSGSRFGGSGTGAFEVQAQDATTRLVLRGSVIHAHTSGVIAGAILEIEDSLVTAYNDLGIWVDEPETRLIVRRSVMSNGVALADETGGDAIAVSREASALVEDSELSDNQSRGAFVEERGRLELVRSTVRRATKDPTGKSGMGISTSAELIARDSAFLDNEGIGVAIREGGSFEAEGCLFSGNVTAGVFGRQDSRIQIAASTFEKNQVSPLNGEFGFGMLAGGAATVRSTLFRDNVYGAIVIDGSNRRDSETVEISGCLVASTKPDASGYGHGILIGNRTLLRMSDSYIVGNHSVGLAFTNASGVIETTVVAGNAVGTHVQDGSRLLESPEAPAEVGAHDVIFTGNTIFKDNGTRVGVGEIPIPNFGGPEG